MRIHINGVDSEIGRISKNRLIPKLKEMVAVQQVSFLRSSIVVYDHPMPGWSMVKTPGLKKFKTVSSEEVFSHA